MIHMKKLKWLIPIIIIVAIGSLVFYGVIAKDISNEDIKIDSISEKDGRLTINGEFNKEKYHYAGYKYKFKNGKMYVSIQGTILTGEKSSSFKIHIKNPAVSTINNVSIVGKGNQEAVHKKIKR